MRLFWLVLLLARVAGAVTVPLGPPASYTGDTWPTPLRTLWIDRCGRGVAGTCGSVACNDSNAGTSQNAPLCTLKALTGKVLPGDLIQLRAGFGVPDGYWEVDDAGGKWAVATLSPDEKGTARCAGGTNSGWSCTSDASCPGSTCDYRPIVLHGYTESDGSVGRIDPEGHDPSTFGGAGGCNGGVAGRYIGVNFGNPSCVSARNDRTECFKGTVEGKPCAVDGDCTGGGKCTNAAYNWIIDGVLFNNWNYYDRDPTHTRALHTCSEKAISINGNGSGGGGCPIAIGVTVQNSEFSNNGGFGVLWANAAAGLRWIHNHVHDSHTRGYTTAVNTWEPRDAQVNRTTYIWGNRIHDNYDDTAPWDLGAICTPISTPPALTCLDGPAKGAVCHGEADCDYGHCGGICSYTPDGIGNNTNPANMGYDCECSADAQCAAGLHCVSTSHAGDSGNTEGRGIMVDRGGVDAHIDIRNNVVWGNAGECIAFFISNAGIPGGTAATQGYVVNNTCYHNAKKGIGFSELWMSSLFAETQNNLIVPLPIGGCERGPKGGQVCTDYEQNVQCGGGAVSNGCRLPTARFWDCFGFGIFSGLTNGTASSTHIDKNLYFINLPGYTANAGGFEWCTPISSGQNWGRFLDYRAYGIANTLTREQNGKSQDPLFVSENPLDPMFLHVTTGSPVLGAGNNAVAPAFDIDGNVRANPPSIGAYEVAAGTTTTSSTAVGATTTTSTVTTTSGGPTTTSTSSTLPGNLPGCFAAATTSGGGPMRVAGACFRTL